MHILHCFRSPVGGIFRHVRDLIGAQVAAGHAVGILCDSITGGPFEEGLIAEVAPACALGVHRLPMRRAIVPSDIRDIARMRHMLRNLDLDVLHGHGAKGGAYARLTGSLLRADGRNVARLYTPHGGSMHYSKRTPGGFVFFRLERALERITDHLLFVSNYEAAAYIDKVGRPAVPYSTIYNGLQPAEFGPVAADADATDFLYVGMLRALKGPDVAIRAIGRLAERNRAATLTVVGDGPQRGELEALAATLAPGRVRFEAPMPIRAALRLGRKLVLPSLAESLPYVVLETLAAEKAVIATAVGGVGEIIPPAIQTLVPPNDPDALADAFAAAIDRPDAPTPALLRHIRDRFTLARMVEDTTAAYARALAFGEHRRLPATPALAGRGRRRKPLHVPHES